MNRLTTLLLATTGLTLLSGQSFATPLVESTDFSNTFAGANVVTQLSPDTISGTVQVSTDTNDYIKWLGLSAGSAYSFLFLGSSGFAFDYNPLNSSDSPLPTSGTVPADGTIVLDVAYDGALCAPTCRGLTEGWTIDLTAIRATAVPEPASLALFGVSLAGLGLIRRRERAKQRSV